jgi:hypothetical protein
MSKRKAALLFSLWLCGCDAAKDPFSRAVAAEGAGNMAEARTLYAEVCTKAADSPLCPVATRRAAQSFVREAFALVDKGQYAQAKDLFTKAQAAGDAAVARAATAALDDAEFKAGLVWEQAAMAPDRAAARKQMLELVEGKSAFSPKAREWLAKNEPQLLLAEIKAACKPDGEGSCSELGKKMADLYPSSSEATEAAALVKADFARVVPVLRQAEGLLVQRLEVFNKKAKFDLCVQQTEADPVVPPESVCASDMNLTESEVKFSTGPIEQMWDKKMAEIHDPALVKQMRDRFQAVADRGEYDRVVWKGPSDKR